MPGILGSPCTSEIVYKTPSITRIPREGLGNHVRGPCTGSGLGGTVNLKARGLVGTLIMRYINYAGPSTYHVFYNA